MAPADASALVAAFGIHLRILDGHVSAVAVLAAADTRGLIAAVGVDSCVLDNSLSAVSTAIVAVATADAGRILATIGLHVATQDLDGVVLVTALATTDASAPLAAFRSPVAAVGHHVSVVDGDGPVAAVFHTTDTGRVTTAVRHDVAAVDDDASHAARVRLKANAGVVPASAVGNEVPVAADAVPDGKFGARPVLVVVAAHADVVGPERLARAQNEVDVSAHADVVVDLRVLAYHPPGLLAPVAPAVRGHVVVLNALVVATFWAAVVNDDHAAQLARIVVLGRHDPRVLLVAVGVGEEERLLLAAVVTGPVVVSGKDLVRILAHDAHLRPCGKGVLDGYALVPRKIHVVGVAAGTHVVLDDGRTRKRELALVIDAAALATRLVTRNAHGRGGHDACVRDAAALETSRVVGHDAAHHRQLIGTRRLSVVDAAALARCRIRLDLRAAHERHDLARRIVVDTAAEFGRIVLDGTAREGQVARSAVVDAASKAVGVIERLGHVVLDDAARHRRFAAVVNTGSTVPAL